MGIRSDVAIALRESVVNALSEESKKTLGFYFDQPVSTTKEGDVLYHAERVKWYYGFYQNLVALYDDLLQFDDDDYLVIVACHDHPSDTEGDLGDWTNNPWQIYRNCSVSVDWSEPA